MKCLHIGPRPSPMTVGSRAVHWDRRSCASTQALLWIDHALRLHCADCGGTLIVQEQHVPGGPFEYPTAARKVTYLSDLILGSAAPNPSSTLFLWVSLLREQYTF
eukprot:TRINITY_DN11457_c0_g1_i6.p1 TRINITY_DN11457_c0_g1~~TRINITY_DN11457_c0_g1_i6.p1  ORF type:complete len:105 (+),score=12.41 TRINITY_DN11457_c0_g1_i6:34-348(+)